LPHVIYFFKLTQSQFLILFITTFYSHIISKRTITNCQIRREIIRQSDSRKRAMRSLFVLLLAHSRMHTSQWILGLNR